MSKILQINITCGVGSTGGLSARLYYATKESGYEALFAYTAFKPTIEKAYAIENKVQHIFRRGLNKYFGKKQKHSSPGTNRLIRFIKREKPDLIHLHNVQQNSVNYIKLFAFLQATKIPIVYTLHDCWAFTGGCYHFFERKCLKYQVGCKDCIIDKDDVNISSGKSYELKKEFIGGNDNIQVVCVSNWLRQVACESYMKEMKRMPITIYNGIDTSIFYPRQSIRAKLGLKQSDFLILGVASYWTEGKGLSYYEKLSNILSNDVKVVLLGNPPAKQAKSNIVWLSPISDKDKLAEIYSSVDLLLNLSTEETFGLTTAEALACGTPAIVMNSTACPEIVSEDTGIVVERKLEDILQAIAQIKLKGKEYYSQNCVKRIQQNFEVKKMEKEYLAVYRGLLNEQDN